jgi:hypothetical protein
LTDEDLELEEIRESDSIEDCIDLDQVAENIISGFKESAKEKLELQVK